jgi:AmmeMemoRadiSam system protein A
MPSPPRSAEDRRALLMIARRAIIAHVSGHTPATEDAAPGPATNPSNGRSEKAAGVFVSLHEHGALRGCIGQLDSDEPLVPALIDAAVAACSRDPRFPPVRADELPHLAIELSILGPLESVATLDDIEVGRHGLLVEQGRRRGLLLPQVAVEHRWSAAMFVSHTCRKAGLSDGAWPGDAVLWRFEAEVFSEP